MAQIVYVPSSRILLVSLLQFLFVSTATIITAGQHTNLDRTERFVDSLFQTLIYGGCLILNALKFLRNGHLPDTQRLVNI